MWGGGGGRGATAPTWGLQNAEHSAQHKGSGSSCQPGTTQHEEPQQCHVHRAGSITAQNTGGRRQHFPAAPSQGESSKDPLALTC